MEKTQLELALEKENEELKALLKAKTPINMSMEEMSRAYDLAINEANKYASLYNEYIAKAEHLKGEMNKILNPEIQKIKKSWYKKK